MLLSRFEQLIALLSQKEVDAFFVTVLNEVSESTQPLRMFALEVQEFLENRPEGVKMVTFLGLPRRKASYASNLLSDLLELLQLYFVRLEARDNLNENFIHLLGKRDAPPSLYLKFWKKANSDNANRPISLNKLKVDYELKAQLYDYSSTIQDRREGTSRIHDLLDMPLEAAMNALNVYTFLQNKKWALDVWIQERVRKGKNNSHSRPPAWNFGKKLALSDDANLLFRMLDLSEQLPESGQAQIYKTMKSLLNSHNFGKEELLQYCFYLQNYCVNEINDRAKGPQNQNYYRNEYLTWVDFKAANGLLLVRGYIPHTDFKNFISCSLKCLPLNAARAQNFYSQQVAHLELTFAAETAAFCQANIWFSEGKYKKCYDLLLKHQFADPFNKTDAKILEIKALYELNETDPFESVLNNAIRYLFRLKMLPAARLTALKNMLNFLKRMYETDPANQKRLRAMKTQLLGMTVVADKDWLLEKITDLII